MYMLLYMLKIILTNKTAISLQEIAVLLVIMYRLNNIFNNIFKDSSSSYLRGLLT